MLRLDLRTSFRISLLVLPILVSLTSWSRLVESGSGPVAVDDSFQVHGATYLDSLLANDSDPDGRFAFFFDSFVSLPQHGTLGGVSYPTAPLYSPDQGYLGTDSWGLSHLRFRVALCDSHRHG